MHSQKATRTEISTRLFQTIGLGSRLKAIDRHERQASDYETFFILMTPFTSLLLLIVEQERPPKGF
jgi:hypothetical protein